MATLKAIRELVIRGSTEGMDKVAADLQKVSAAQKQVADAALSAAKVTEDSTRSQVSAARSFDRVAASLDPTFRAYQQTARAQSVFDRALAQGVITNEQYAASLARLQGRYGGLGAANNNLVGQTSNLAAQFQDIAVQLQSGASPFTVALQQGTQIAAVLGETGGGARGAVKALGAAFMSALSPISLLTVGAIAAGGALIQYFSGAGKETEKLDDRLKAHAELIRGFKEAYGEAAEGLENYAAQSGRVFEAQMRANMEKLKGDMQRLWFEMYANVTTTMGPAFTDAMGNSFGGADTALDPKFAAYRQAFEDLNRSAADGVPDIRAFREEVARVIAESGDNQKVRDLGNELLKNSEDAAKVEAALTKAAQAIRVATGAAGEGIGDIKAFNKALDDLSRIAAPNLTPQQQALEKYREAIGKAGGREERAAAQAAYDAALGRAAERDAEKAAEEARRMAEADARRREQTWDRAVDRAQDQTRALEQQAETYGMGAGEVARYRTEQELLNAAWEAGKADTPQLRAQIAAMANEAGAAADRMENLRNAAEWSDFSKGTLKGFISDLRQGKSAADAFANALERIADRLLDMTLDWMFGAQGGNGNPFASLFSAFTAGSSGTGRGASGTLTTGSTGFEGLGKLPDVVSSAVEPLTKNIQAAASAIRTIESGSAAGNYAALGPLTKSGDRAYGAYQVMGNNVGPWTEQHFGQRLTPNEFLSNPAAQDAVFAGEFGGYMDRFGPGGAAQAWFGGPGSVGKVGRMDVLGTSVGGYSSRFESLYRQNGGAQALSGTAGNDNVLGGMGSDMEMLSGDFDKLSQSMTSATPQITQGLTGLSNITQQGGDMVGTALQGTADTIGQGANGIGQAINQLGQSLNSGGGGGGGFGNLLSMFGGGGSSGGDMFSGGGALDWGQYMGGATFSAKGNVFDGSKGLSAYSGSIVDQPTLFAFARGAGIMGEAGPEAILPLTRDAAGRLGVRTQGGLSRDDVAAIRGGGTGSGVTVNNQVIDQSGRGVEVQSEAQQNSDGSIDIVTVLSDKVKDDIRRGARRNDSFSREVGGGQFRGRG